MSFDMDTSSLGSASGDKELQQFIQMEQQKAQLQVQVHKLTDVCWDQCFDKPRDKLDSRTENCMSNCVDRFIDVSLLVTQRFQQLLQRSGKLNTGINTVYSILYTGISSAVDEHQMDAGHAIAWGDVTVMILKPEPKFYARKLREAIEFDRKKSSLRRDKGLDLPAVSYGLL